MVLLVIVVLSCISIVLSLILHFMKKGGGTAPSKNSSTQEKVKSTIKSTAEKGLSFSKVVIKSLRNLLVVFGANLLIIELVVCITVVAVSGSFISLYCTMDEAGNIQFSDEVLKTLGTTSPNQNTSEVSGKCLSGPEALIESCNWYASQLDVAVKKGEKWWYSNSNKKVYQTGYFEDMLNYGKKKGKYRGGNCASLANWGLREMGILGRGSKIHCQSDGMHWSSSTKKRVLESMNLLTFKGSGKNFQTLVSDGKIQAGDICFGSGHTFVYRGGEYCFASGHDSKWHKGPYQATDDTRKAVFDKWIRKYKGTSNGKFKVWYVLRFKSDFVPKKYRSMSGEIVKNTGTITSESAIVASGEAAKIPLSKRMKWLFPDGTPKSKKDMEKYLTTITVKCKQSNGKDANVSLTVHSKLAGEITAIYNEMYALGFPVQKGQTYGYSWRSMATSGNRSHHSYGVAIDINPNENYMITKSGKVVAGKLYKPGANKLSVTKEVVTIWKRHGFYWGGDWRSSKDYMHFSYTNH